MYDIYYAHHQWKYNTPIELYELDLISRKWEIWLWMYWVTKLLQGSQMSNHTQV